MDVLFLVVDSLRAHPFGDGSVAATPFLDSLVERSVRFTRAYSTECWTLPSHASMFTGLMPSEHGAHFQTMAYGGAAPTLSERLSGRGYRTELVTRNFVFDGTIPGITRGFQEHTAILGKAAGWDPTATFLALAKPRFRRHLRNTGFFHGLQRGDRRFLETFARTLQPADDRALSYLVERAGELRSRNRRFFLFANLYDVHAPYAPSPDSLLRPWCTPTGIKENLLAPYALSRLGEHRYLRRSFQMAEAVRAMLEARYRRAVELMDRKLSRFFDRLLTESLLQDTLVILTSDHGEGFGEHGLFLHDASVYETHLHVPLWICTPDSRRGTVDDVVSTRHLGGLVEGVVARRSGETILDPSFRARHPVAYAQHYHYPHLENPRPMYRSDQFAAISRSHKAILRDGRAEVFELPDDARELSPTSAGWREALDGVAAQSGGGAVAAAKVRAEAARYAALTVTARGR